MAKQKKVIAPMSKAKQERKILPKDAKAVVAMEKMATKIQKARELYGDGQPFDEERILDCMVFRAERSAVEVLMFGKYCHWLKEEVGYGRFTEDLTKRNIDHRAANWAMLMFDKFGPNSSALTNLGTTKARCITFFDKEEIAAYEKGGPLRDIPHDDVARMTTRELEVEVRKLREKEKKTEAVIKEKIRQKDEQIAKLEMEAEYRQPPTKAQVAQAALEALSGNYTIVLFGEIKASIHKAYNIVREAEKTPGVNVQQLNEWLGQFSNAMKDIEDARQIWLDEVDNASPIEVGKIRDVSDLG
jgi:hypothetical protein